MVNVSCSSQIAQLASLLNVMMHICKCVSLQWCNSSHCFHPPGLRLWLLLLVHGWVWQRKICRCADTVFDFAHLMVTFFNDCGVYALPNSSLGEVLLCVCICQQVRRWSSSALGKVFFATPSRATTPVSLPTDKLVNYTKRGHCFLTIWRTSCVFATIV